MNAKVFMKKECLELKKTGRGYILIALFLFIAMLSPILAKYMNEIIEKASGLNILATKPTVIDSFSQFYKNLDSMGILIISIISVGIVISEKKNGSIILMLSKGLTRTNFLISKFNVYIIFYSLLYVVSILIFLLYTKFLFGSIEVDNFIMSIFSFWLYGVLMISISLFISTIISNFAQGVCIVIFVSIIGFNILTLFKNIAFISPIYLETIAKQCITGTIPAHVTLSIILNIIYIALCFGGSILIFKKQEL